MERSEAEAILRGEPALAVEVCSLAQRQRIFAPVEPRAGRLDPSCLRQASAGFPWSAWRSCHRRRLAGMSPLPAHQLGDRSGAKGDSYCYLGSAPSDDLSRNFPATICRGGTVTKGSVIAFDRRRCA